MCRGPGEEGGGGGVRGRAPAAMIQRGMPPSREERDAWLRLATTDVAAFNQAIHDLDGQFRIDLRGADLSGRDLSSLQLGRSDLRGARLRGATVHAGTLVSCRLQDTELTDVRYVDAGDDHAMRKLKMLRLLSSDVARSTPRVERSRASTWPISRKPSLATRT